MRNRLVHTHMWWIKIQERYLGSEESQPHTRPPSPGFPCREISTHNFWLQNPAETESVKETAGSLSSYS